MHLEQIHFMTESVYHSFTSRLEKNSVKISILQSIIVLVASLMILQLGLDLIGKELYYFESGFCQFDSSSIGINNYLINDSCVQDGPNSYSGLKPYRNVFAIISYLIISVGILQSIKKKDTLSRVQGALILAFGVLIFIIGFKEEFGETSTFNVKILGLDLDSIFAIGTFILAFFIFFSIIIWGFSMIPNKIVQSIGLGLYAIIVLFISVSYLTIPLVAIFLFGVFMLPLVLTKKFYESYEEYRKLIFVSLWVLFLYLMSDLTYIGVEFRMLGHIVVAIGVINFLKIEDVKNHIANSQYLRTIIYATMLMVIFPAIIFLLIGILYVFSLGSVNLFFVFEGSRFFYLTLIPAGLLLGYVRFNLDKIFLYKNDHSSRIGLIQALILIIAGRLITIFSAHDVMYALTADNDSYYDSNTFDIDVILFSINLIIFWGVLFLSLAILEIRKIKIVAIGLR